MWRWKMLKDMFIHRFNFPGYILWRFIEYLHRWVYTRCCGQSAKILKEHLQSVKVGFYLDCKVYFYLFSKVYFICLAKYLFFIYLCALTNGESPFTFVPRIPGRKKYFKFTFIHNLWRNQNFHFHPSLLINTFTFNVIFKFSRCGNFHFCLPLQFVKFHNFIKPTLYSSATVFDEDWGSIQLIAQLILFAFWFLFVYVNRQIQKT